MKYVCNVCQWIYDEENEEKKFNELPEDWVCPICGAGKEMFSEIEKYSNFFYLHVLLIT